MRNSSLIKKITALLLVLTMGVGLTACRKDSITNNDSGKSEAERGEYNIDLKLEDGTIIGMLSPKMSEYLALDSKNTDEIAKFLYSADTTWYYDGFSTISWSDTGAESYDVLFSTSDTMENPFIVETTETELCTDDCVFLEPGVTYYWKVIGNNQEGRGSFSETRSFTVKDETVRIIHVDGVENVRDIGGWETADGTGRVKYGMIYRGGRLNKDQSVNKTYITEQGIYTMRDELGIRSEIDLRGSADSDGQVECAFGNELNYNMWSIASYGQVIPGYSKIFNGINSKYDKNSAASIKLIFEFLADESNYPMYIHCNYGADRTGTIIFLINGLLGVGYEDLVKDFELTSLSASERRWRSDILYDSASETYSFTEDGVMQANENNVVTFGDFYKVLMEKYGQGTDLQGAVEKYLTTACGVKQETISSVKNILLEEK